MANKMFGVTLPDYERLKHMRIREVGMTPDVLMDIVQKEKQEEHRKEEEERERSRREKYNIHDNYLYSDDRDFVSDDMRKKRVGGGNKNKDPFFRIKTDQVVSLLGADKEVIGEYHQTQKTRKNVKKDRK